MQKNLPLRSQPGSFWLGVALVSEAPFTVIALFLSESTKEAVINFIMSGPLGVISMLVVLSVSLFLTAWLGHRAGLGL